MATYEEKKVVEEKKIAPLVIAPTKVSDLLVDIGKTHGVKASAVLSFNRIAEYIRFYKTSPSALEDLAAQILANAGAWSEAIFTSSDAPLAEQKK